MVVSRSSKRWCSDWVLLCASICSRNLGVYVHIWEGRVRRGQRSVWYRQTGNQPIQNWMFFLPLQLERTSKSAGIPSKKSGRYIKITGLPLKTGWSLGHFLSLPGESSTECRGQGQGNCQSRGWRGCQGHSRIIIDDTEMGRKNVKQSRVNWT